jgi:hypothetical protein
VRGKAVAAFLQRLALFEIVEQLAVENDADGAVFVEDRLPAVGQTDDAQTARCQAKTRQKQ